MCVEEDAERLPLAVRVAERHAHRALRSRSPARRRSPSAHNLGRRWEAPSTAATPTARRAAAERLRLVDTGGSTNLGDGWLTGEVGRALTDDAVGRCILLTDGAANDGIVDAAELGQHARALRARAA
jgi:hypothetical protein